MGGGAGDYGGGVVSFFKVHRGWQDSDFFLEDSEPYSQKDAWIWMIGEANFKDKRVSVNNQPHMLKRGQFRASIRFMSDKFQWSPGRVQRFLEKLKNWQMIDTAIDTGQTIITICNYSKYQDDKRNAGTASDTSSDTAAIQQRYTNGHKLEEGKEGKEGKEKDLEKGRSLDSEPQPRTDKASPGQKGEKLENYLTREFPDAPESCPQEWGESALADALRYRPTTKTDFGKLINWHFEKFFNHFRSSTKANARKSDWRRAWLNWWKTEFEKIAKQEERDEFYAQQRSLRGK